MSEIMSGDYTAVLEEVKTRIRSAQYAALKAVNRELIGLYWDIGKLIVERQTGKTWGRSIVTRLATDLQAEFPGIQGFSAANLWRMRHFYEVYGPQEKLAPLVREIGWAHNVVIMEKCKDDLEREFYIRMTRKYGWTKAVLTHQIENRTYEKTLLNQTNFHATLPEEVRKRAKLAVKDEYTFDFLELSGTSGKFMRLRAPERYRVCDGDGDDGDDGAVPSGRDDHGRSSRAWRPPQPHRSPPTSRNASP